MKHIKGILFDIGDTLIAATALQNSALTATVKSLAWVKRPNDFIRSYSQADNHDSLKDQPDLNHLYSDIRIVSLTFKSLGWNFSKDKTDEFLRIYRKELRKRVRPKPSLNRILKVLKKKKILLGIVSNGTTKEQHEQLERMKIKDWFDPIIISEEVGLRKPDPAILAAANQSWKLKSDEILVLGDRPDWECLAAARAGMLRGLTIQYVDHRDAITSETRPDITIKNIEELTELV